MRLSCTALSLVLLACIPPAVSAQGGNDVPWKSFSEVTRGAEVGTGIFTIYYRRDNIYLSLRPDQFDHDYLLVTQISQGIGELGLDGGSSIRSDLVRFHREGDRVELWVVNSHMAAAPGSPMAGTVAYSFGTPSSSRFRSPPPASPARSWWT